jgi:hypothetical protein
MRFRGPAFQLSEWWCQGTTLPARRAAMGNEPKLAKLFAHAELKQGRLRHDWVLWRLGDDNQESPVARTIVTRKSSQELVLMQLFSVSAHYSNVHYSNVVWLN